MTDKTELAKEQYNGPCVVLIRSKNVKDNADYYVGHKNFVTDKIKESKVFMSVVEAIRVITVTQAFTKTYIRSIVPIRIFQSGNAINFDDVDVDALKSPITNGAIINDAYAVSGSMTTAIPVNPYHGYLPNGGLTKTKPLDETIYKSTIVKQKEKDFIEALHKSLDGRLKNETEPD